MDMYNMYNMGFLTDLEHKLGHNHCLHPPLHHVQVPEQWVVLN